MNMSFWKNVDNELVYQGINRKTLAKEAEFDVSNIGKGIKQGNVPSADTAFKIAKALNVSVEYLITGNQYATKENKTNKIKMIDESEIQLMKKYHTLIEKCENLSSSQIKLLEQIAENFILNHINS